MMAARDKRLLEDLRIASRKYHYGGKEKSAYDRGWRAGWDARGEV